VLSISLRRAIMNPVSASGNEHYRAPRILSERELLAAPQHPSR
jgi:hypothetical protein